MVDFHSHILPGIDDGAKNTEQSLKMLAAVKKSGINAVVATPHFYADRDYPAAFIDRRRSAYEKVTASAKEKGIDIPNIILGAEVAYFEGVSDCEELRELKIAGTETILIEMPSIAWNERMTSEVSDIYEKWGLIPIIAHIDRYIIHFGKKNIADHFEGLPVIIQANASFFEGFRNSRLALKLFDRSVIHLVGSDCHNTDTRPPNVNIAFDAIRNKFGEGAVAKINETERQIFQGRRRSVFSAAYR